MRSDFSLNIINTPQYQETKKAKHVYVCMVITFSKGKDRPVKVANLARG